MIQVVIELLMGLNCSSTLGFKWRLSQNNGFRYLYLAFIAVNSTTLHNELIILI